MSAPGASTGHAADQAFNTRIKMVALDLRDPSLVFRGVKVQPLRLPSGMLRTPPLPVPVELSGQLTPVTLAQSSKGKARPTGVQNNHSVQ